MSKLKPVPSYYQMEVLFSDVLSSSPLFILSLRRTNDSTAGNCFSLVKAPKKRL